MQGTHPVGSRSFPKSYVILSILGSLLFFGLILWPIPKDKHSFSKALYDREGRLLSAISSSEHQWRFPLDRDLPEPFIHCLRLYEDEYLYYHMGVNPLSILKSAYVNIRARKTIRGGSTIAMQVARMRRNRRKRNLWDKTIEALTAIKMTIFWGRKKVLKTWAETAPYGSNIVGIRAASLFYFGKELEGLSWPQYALLAVLPNQPGMTHPGKNTHKLKLRRNQLLKKLATKGYFPSTELSHFEDEDLPQAFHHLPQHAYHLLQYLISKNPNQCIFHTTIDENLQLALTELLKDELYHLRKEGIQHASAIIVSPEKNTLLAYVGNLPDEKGSFQYTDLIQAQRSYGSLLKPILYADALEKGHYLPGQFIEDIPIQIGDYRPKNFDRQYRGMVPIEAMVSQSLNVPAVNILYKIGLPSFYQTLKQLELNSINKGPLHYGLSIILGGAESTLWEMARIYKGLAQNFMGMANPYSEIQVLSNAMPSRGKNPFSYSAFAINHTIEAMSNLERPREDKSWMFFSNGKKIAWKTGTSFGLRDAWCMGFNQNYLVGIWVGNQNGEGRHHLTGISKAAPILFRMFDRLDQSQWFATPQSPIATKAVIVCKESGLLAGKFCKYRQKMPVKEESHQYSTCTYHDTCYINEQGFRCFAHSPDRLKLDTFFTLPTHIAYYYQKHHPSYAGLPTHSGDAEYGASGKLAIIYPHGGMKITLPKDSPYRQNELILRAYTEVPGTTLFWFLNENHIFTSQSQNHTHLHTTFIPEGHYTLSIINERGASHSVQFDVLAAKPQN